MEQKKFMDISRIKEDTELTVANTNGFEVGDLIVIQEKVDGSNAGIAYDIETDCEKLEKWDCYGQANPILK